MNPGKSTHSQQLERWLGTEAVERVVRSMEKFYYPIAMHGVPGKVYAMPGGGFAGEIKAGYEMSALDRAVDTLNRENRARRARLAEQSVWNSFGKERELNTRRHMAFGSLSDVVAAATGGKSQTRYFQKTGAAANAAGNANDLWTRAAMPAAGAAGGALPGGTIPTSATQGALPFVNPTVADSNHFLTGYVTSSVANSLLLYDRLWAGVINPNSAALQAITGTPNRYQSTTPTDVEFIGGNFMFPSNPTTVLAATAHNWVGGAVSAGTQYTNHTGTTGRYGGLIAGVSACVVGGVDLAVGNWFMPLAAGDVGVKNVTQVQLSAAVATGTLDLVIGHPIAIFPCPIANVVTVVDGLNTAFNLTSIVDDAALAFLELPKSSTAASNYSGVITTVSE